MDWFDDLRQEFAYAYRAVSEWWYDDDNKTAAWLIGVIVCFATLLISFGGFFLLKAVYYAETGDRVITIVQGNPCLTENGLIKAYAPKQCYFDQQTAAQRFGLTKPAVPAPPPAPEPAKEDHLYNPPCATQPGCGDAIYGKVLFEGIVLSAEYHDDNKYFENGHLEPDDTSVTIHPTHEGGKDGGRFCGNMVRRFTPGEYVKLVINQSEQADYNGCYTIEPVIYTFKGDRYH